MSTTSVLMSTTSVLKHRSAFLLPAMLVATLFIFSLSLSSSAGASNATLHAKINSWSRLIGVDAHSVALAAQRRHPRRMTYSANRFRRHAIRARVAVAAQHPSSAKGVSAKRLALKAFTDYARAGSLWAACGRARLSGHRPAARKFARTAATYAKAGNRLLVAAGKLLG
jgi:hypothetical protein